MRLLISLSSLLLALPALSAQGIYSQEAEDLKNIWVISEYDPARDPAADLQLAVGKAQAEGKRILLEVGGTWCGWCARLDMFVHEHPAVAQNLAANFMILKVSWSKENQNEAFLSQYPEIRGYPHLFVLDTDGAFLYSQGTGELEEGSSYNQEAVLEFLRTWVPT